MLHSNTPPLKSCQKTTHKMALRVYTYSHGVKTPNHNTHAPFCVFNHFTIVSNTDRLYTKSEINHSQSSSATISTAISSNSFCLSNFFPFHNLWVQGGAPHLVWCLQNISFSLKLNILNDSLHNKNMYFHLCNTTSHM